MRDIRYWSIRSSPEELGGSYRLGATGYISQHGYQESHVVYGVLPSMYIYWHGLSLRASDLSTSFDSRQHLLAPHTTHALRPSPSATIHQVSARFCDRDAVGDIDIKGNLKKKSCFGLKDSCYIYVIITCVMYPNNCSNSANIVDNDQEKDRAITCA